MPIRPLKFAPGPGFWARTAGVLAGRYPQGFGALQVLVPAFSHAQLLKEALARELGRAFIAPRINTVNGWLAQHTLRHQALAPSDSARLMGLYAELRQHGWLKKLFAARHNTDLLPLADMLLTLSDELTRALLPQALTAADGLDARWEQALAQLPPPARRLLSDEAQLVWSIWKGQLERNDKTALRHANLLALAEQAVDDLVWIAPVAPDALEQAFLDHYARRCTVHVIGLDWRPRALPALLRQAWREMPEDAQAARPRDAAGLADDDAPPFDDGDDTADDDAAMPPAAWDGTDRVATPPGVTLLPCKSLEHEALLGAQTVLDWLAGGKSTVAIVAQDRVVTRRIRALLERAQVRVMDETGWKLSTTRAAAAIAAWLDIVATRGDTVTLLDFLKSPFVCARLHGKARQLMLLETMLRRANITGGWRAILAASARAQARHDAAAASRDAPPARPIRPDVHDTEHDYVRHMLAQKGFGERDSFGAGFGDRALAWREAYDFATPAEEDGDLLRHDAAELQPTAPDFSEVDYVPDTAAAAYGDDAFDAQGAEAPPAHDAPPPGWDGEAAAMPAGADAAASDLADAPSGGAPDAAPARSRFTLDHDIAPAEMTVFDLVAHIAAQAAQFAGTRTIAEWGVLMADTLQLFGMTSSLTGDDAGRQVVDLLANLAGGFEAGTKFSFNEWRACVAGQMEATAFVAPGADPRVVMLPLNGARLRAFEAVLVAGVDADHLPSAAPETLFFANAVRRELGLETRESRQRQQMRDLAEVLLANPVVTLSWQAHKEGEPNPVSPWIERLQLALARAGENPLAPHRTAIPRVGLVADLPSMPMPRAGALLPAKLSASAYNTFIACPYQFFVTRMLRLFGIDELSELPEKRDYGDWLHKILKTFHEALAEQPEQDRLALLADISEAVFGPELQKSAAALGYYARWQKTIPAYLAWAEAREREGWRFAFGEQDFERKLEWEGGGILLAGRIDRIDRHADGGYAVLDYKTTNVNTLKGRFRTLEDQQLPFYGLLSGLEVESAHYVALELSSDKNGMRTGDAAAPDYARWQQALQRHIVENMAAVQGGRTIPANGVASVCQYCDVRGMCRKGAW